MRGVAYLCPYTSMVVLKSCFVLQNPNQHYRFQAIGGSDKFISSQDVISFQDQMVRDQLVSSLLKDQTIVLDSSSDSDWVSLLAETRDGINFSFKTLGLSKDERSVDVANPEAIYKE